jgi:orotate phosphoribosyltransferase
MARPRPPAGRRAAVRGWAAELARRAAPSQPEVVCGPLTGGAFVAQAVAAELGADFVFAGRLGRRQDQ